MYIGLSGVFIQDIYDGINAGQIFDIDPSSDAYAEPIRPDLPPTWTSVLDASLSTVLPNMPSVESFWRENAGVLQEFFEAGVGSSSKERAVSIRCGQLRYLRQRAPEEGAVAM